MHEWSLEMLYYNRQKLYQL